MRFSLVSLLLLTLIAAIFLAAWNQPTALSAHACTALFAATLMASSVVALIRRDQRRWMACGFAVTGFVLSLMLGLGKPVKWRDLSIDRLVVDSGELRSRGNIIHRQYTLKHLADGNIAEYERTYGPYDPEKRIETISGRMTLKQARLQILHAISLFCLSLFGGTTTVLCRRRNAYSYFLLASATIGATIFNTFCILFAWRFGLAGTITGTLFALILSILLVIAARLPSVRSGAAAFLLIAGALFFESTSREIDYTTPLPKNSAILQMYHLLIPVQKKAHVGAVFVDGAVVFASVVHDDGIFDVEFAEVVKCFVATSLGSVAAMGTLLAFSLQRRIFARARQQSNE